MRDYGEVLQLVNEAKARAELLSKSLEQHYGYVSASQVKELVDIFLLMLTPIEKGAE